MQKEHLEVIQNLKHKRLLYLSDDSYSSLSNFIQGLELGIFLNSSFNFSKEFHSWLEEKNNLKCSLHWSNFILVKMSNSNEILASAILFDLLEEFLSPLQNN